MQDQTVVESLMSEAESLFLSALQIVTSSLGECHLRTSSAYSNLGRLYHVNQDHSAVIRYQL